VEQVAEEMVDIVVQQSLEQQEQLTPEVVVEALAERQELHMELLQVDQV
tara:strand:+ start:508 stop:654 length:147 start_codon:yes stop_codon:yes gene_type:complete